MTIGLTVAATLVTAGGQMYAADAQAQQMKYQAAVAKENRKLELANVKDARRRGELEQMRHWRRVSQLEGAQRAQMGAMGLDLGFGSPSDILLETAQMGYEDSSTISENTDREVRGYEIRAANYANEAKAAKYGAKTAKTAGYIGAAGTILSGASQLYGQKGVGSGSSVPRSQGFTGPPS